MTFCPVVALSLDCKGFPILTALSNSSVKHSYICWKPLVKQLDKMQEGHPHQSLPMRPGKRRLSTTLSLMGEREWESPGADGCFVFVG